MFDDTNVSAMPGGAAAYAGYVGGNWPTYNELKAKFPNARLMSIAVNAGEDAECLDVEPGDATNAAIYGWFKRQLARKQWRPVIYTSVSNIDAVVATMTANGFARSSYRLWSAHYGAGQHICGPSTCKLTRTAVDGTQWTSTAMGKSLDESILSAGFFPSLQPKSAPKPAPKPTGPFRQVVPKGNSKSLDEILSERGAKWSTVMELSRTNLNAKHLPLFDTYVSYDYARHNAGLSRPTAPAGLVYYTVNP